MKNRSLTNSLKIFNKSEQELKELIKAEVIAVLTEKFNDLKKYNKQHALCNGSKCESCMLEKECNYY